MSSLPYWVFKNSLFWTSILKVAFGISNSVNRSQTFWDISSAALSLASWSLSATLSYSSIVWSLLFISSWSFESKLSEIFNFLFASSKNPYKVLEEVLNFLATDRRVEILSSISASSASLDSVSFARSSSASKTSDSSIEVDSRRFFKESVISLFILSRFFITWDKTEGMAKDWREFNDDFMRLSLEQSLASFILLSRRSVSSFSLMSRALSSEAIWE